MIYACASPGAFRFRARRLAWFPPISRVPRVLRLPRRVLRIAVLTPAHTRHPHTRCNAYK